MTPNEIKKELTSILLLMRHNTTDMWKHDLDDTIQVVVLEDKDEKEYPDETVEYNKWYQRLLKLTSSISDKPSPLHRQMVKALEASNKIFADYNPDVATSTPEERKTFTAAWNKVESALNNSKQ